MVKGIQAFRPVIGPCISLKIGDIFIACFFLMKEGNTFLDFATYIYGRFFARVFVAGCFYRDSKFAASPVAAKDTATVSGGAVPVRAGKSAV